jgi:hypothetical protein
VFDLVLKLFDLVDVPILVLQDIFQHLTRGKVSNFSCHNDRRVVLFDSAFLSGVIVFKLLWHLRANMHIQQLGDHGNPFQKQDSANELFGVLHFVNCTLFEMIVELAIAPVLGHARRHHVLANGSQFVCQQGVQSLDEFRVSLRDLLLSNEWFCLVDLIVLNVVPFGVVFKP